MENCLCTAHRNGSNWTRYLDTLKNGDAVKIKGPAGPVLYFGNGRFHIHGFSVNVKQISMIAGGTGITPMYQLAKAIVKDPKDKTQIKLVYSNHTEEDVSKNHCKS